MDEDLSAINKHNNSANNRSNRQTFLLQTARIKLLLYLELPLQWTEGGGRGLDLGEDRAHSRPPTYTFQEPKKFRIGQLLQW
jgi:hypothetical protein